MCHKARLSRRFADTAHCLGDRGTLPPRPQSHRSRSGEGPHPTYLHLQQYGGDEGGGQHAYGGRAHDRGYECDRGERMDGYRERAYRQVVVRRSPNVHYRGR